MGFFLSVSSRCGAVLVCVATCCHLIQCSCSVLFVHCSRSGSSSPLVDKSIAHVFGAHFLLDGAKHLRGSKAALAWERARHIECISSSDVVGLLLLLKSLR